MKVRIEVLFGVMAITAGLSLPMAVQAAPADGAGRHGKLIEKLDKDGDGTISPEEWKAARDARFQAQDADKDGSISKEELLADARKKAEARAERAFTKMDADGDGKVSKAEFEAANEKKHKHMKERRAHKAGKDAPKPDAPAGKQE